MENVKKVLKWLKYDQGENRTRFQFIATHSENLTENKKEELFKQACKMFGLGDTMRFSIENKKDLKSLIYTGFPPEDMLNAKGKEIVERDFKRLMDLTQVPGIAPRISVEESGTCTFL